MTTDSILVKRVTDGERCSSKCRGYDWDADECSYFDQPLQYDGGPHLRCPSCLATPSAPALTAEHQRTIRCMFTALDSIGPSEEIAEAKAAFPWLEEAPHD